jgi:predicted nucleic acid-binding protein
MKLVVDSNVFIGAALKESSWRGAVVRWLERFDGLLKTSVTEQEVFEVLQRPRIAEDIVPLYAVRLHRIFAAAELVVPAEPVTAEG